MYYRNFLHYTKRTYCGIFTELNNSYKYQLYSISNIYRKKQKTNKLGNEIKHIKINKLIQ